jgi:hypothetical protein
MFTKHTDTFEERRRSNFVLIFKLYFRCEQWVTRDKKESKVYRFSVGRRLN